MNAKAPFDLLSTVEQGGCSAKLPPGILESILAGLKPAASERLLVGCETNDDAAVWQLNEDTAIISTADFFPPMCSDPFTFGQIAAANALSDVFAMGGQALVCLNLAMFPTDRIEIEVLEQILAGGADVVAQAGAHLAGGHTIEDYPPKYGLAVLGSVHPDHVVRNDRARVGDALVLTKPIGTGTILAGERMGETSAEHLAGALESMIQLNLGAVDVMRAHGIVCATDITGFGLLGHGLEMAAGSGVSLELSAANVPLLPGAHALAEMGCIPTASFHNLSHVEDRAWFDGDLDYALKMLMVDAQTSGGLLMCCVEERADDVVADLKSSGSLEARRVGAVRELAPSGPRIQIR